MILFYFLSPTFSRARDAVGFEVACAFLPAVLLSVGVGGRRGVQLGAGGARDAGAGTHRIAQARVCSGVGGREKGRTIRMLPDSRELMAGIPATTPGCSQVCSGDSPNNIHLFFFFQKGTKKPQLGQSADSRPVRLTGLSINSRSRPAGMHKNNGKESILLLPNAPSSKDPP